MSGRIAVVGGTGAEGSGLAWRWTQAGEEIIIGSRDAKRAQQTAEKIKAKVGPENIAALLARGRK